jgi:ADP-ribose pyrophosphatase YjhB (NUDIX family)
MSEKRTLSHDEADLSSDSEEQIEILSNTNPPDKIDVDLTNVRRLVYSKRVLDKFGWSMITSKEPIYVFDPNQKTFFKMSMVFPSMFTYGGANNVLQTLRDQDDTKYIITPMYATDLVETSNNQNRNRTSSCSSSKANKKSNSKPVLIASSRTNVNTCNAGDIQSMFGGKTKNDEEFLDAVIREAFEESGLSFEPTEIVEHDTQMEKAISNPDRVIETKCYHVSIDSIRFVDTNEIEDGDSNTNSDDKFRKVCLAVYGDAQDICNALMRIPVSELGDNIIALVVMPIGVALQIDDHAIEMGKKIVRRRTNSFGNRQNSNRGNSRGQNRGSNRGQNRGSNRGQNRGSNRGQNRGSNRGQNRGRSRGRPSG